MSAHGFEGRTLSDTGFGQDDGSTPAVLAAALRSTDPGSVVTALLECRVLVAVVATGEPAEGAGAAREKSAEMAVVTIRIPDGPLGLPAFSSTEALGAWHPTARPVPVAGAAAAQAAYDEGASALLLDPAGPAPFVLHGPALRALAEGRPLLPAVEDPDVVSAVRTAATQAGIRSEDVRLRAGTDTDLVVTVTGSDLDGLADLMQRFGELLAHEPVLRARLGRGLDVEVLE